MGLFLSYWERKIMITNRSWIYFKSDLRTAILTVFHDCNENIPGLWRDKIKIHVALVLRQTCFTPYYFNALAKYTPLLNLHSLVFSLKPLRWLRSVMLTPTFSSIFLWLWSFIYSFLIYAHFFQENQPGGKTRL